MKPSSTWILIAAGLALRCAGPEHLALATSPPARCVSVAGHGSRANGESGYPSLSSDGRCVAFASSASNLVSGDENESGDVFVARGGEAPVCASVARDGRPAAGESYAPSLSADGSRVVFASAAADLVAGDENRVADVFLRDLRERTTVRISVPQAGAEADGESYAPRISGDGRWAAFASRATNLVPGDANGQADVFLCDLGSGTLERVSAAEAGGDGDGPSEGPALSADGRFVAFASQASNLVPGGRARGVWDVYLRDRGAGTLVLVSAAPGGGGGDGHSFAPAISADGRYVAFASHARNLVAGDLVAGPEVFVRDLQSGTTQRIGGGLRPALSADGGLVAFEDGSSVLLRERAGGTAARLGAGSAAALSADGRWLAYASAESEPGDVLVRGPLR